MDDKLRQAIDLIKQGNKCQAKKLLEEIIKSDPKNELAWMWLATCIEDAKGRIFCLKKVLEINPGNSKARLALEKLEPEEPSVEAITSTIIQRTTGEVQHEPKPEQRRAVQTAKSNTKLFGIQRDSLIIILLASLLVVIFFVIAALLIKNKSSASVRSAVADTQRRLATITAEPFQQNVAPTLPPKSISTSTPEPQMLYPGPARKYITSFTNALPSNYQASDEHETRDDQGGSYYSLSYLPVINGGEINLDVPNYYYWAFVGDSVDSAKKKFKEICEDNSADNNDYHYEISKVTYHSSRFDDVFQYQGIRKIGIFGEMGRIIRKGNIVVAIWSSIRNLNGINQSDMDKLLEAIDINTRLVENSLPK